MFIKIFSSFYGHIKTQYFLQQNHLKYGVRKLTKRRIQGFFPPISTCKDTNFYSFSKSRKTREDTAKILQKSKKRGMVHGVERRRLLITNMVRKWVLTLKLTQKPKNEIMPREVRLQKVPRALGLNENKRLAQTRQHCRSRSTWRVGRVSAGNSGLRLKTTPELQRSRDKQRQFLSYGRNIQLLQHRGAPTFVI